MTTAPPDFARRLLLLLLLQEPVLFRTGVLVLVSPALVMGRRASSAADLPQVRGGLRLVRVAVVARRGDDRRLVGVAHPGGGAATAGGRDGTSGSRTFLFG